MKERFITKINFNHQQFSSGNLITGKRYNDNDTEYSHNRYRNFIDFIKYITSYLN